ncbi:MAG: TonB-dependent receptor, partial [Sandarakinorhabdus sp.]|nr:TonB-dependent receptor [Sandarakinorhabdus sp.]
MLQCLTRRAVSRLALVTTFLTPVAAMAQTAISLPTSAATTEAPEDAAIIVTGSRISAAGYTAPTPVTVVGEEIILRDARATIGDSIRELPAVGASASPNNTSGAGNIVAGVTGLDTVNLRNLGVTRTLVLFDGQRVVQSNVTGQIDIGTIPTALVQRIDVVTAGASAAWGSDAVSGVVNLILNKKFEGIKASIEAGDTSAFDRFNYRAQLALGTSFNDGKGRAIIAGNFFDAPSNVFANQRNWNTYTQLVNNPNYNATNSEPRFIHAANVNLSGAATGGLIVNGCKLAISAAGTCPTGGAVVPGALFNQQFTGANGALVGFPTSNVSGQVASNADTLQASLNNLAIRYRTGSVFGLFSYELADWLKISVQGNYGTTFSRNNSVPFIRIGAQAPLIRLDNPYLPDAVRTQMVAQGLTAINVGTTNINNATADTLSYDNFAANSIGVPVATTDRKLKRAVLSLDGDLGGGWSYNAYFQRGEVTVFQTTESNAIVGNFTKAVDAVRNAAGAIVCRINAVTVVDPACQPLNILGQGVASQAAIRYINVAQGQNFQRQRLEQNVGAVSAQGTLPFGLAAGHIALAFGAEARSEKGTITNDPGAQARIYSVANFPSFKGKYNVKEAFAEIDVPLIKDGFIDALNFNGAMRVTDYSTSGSVTTWKLGATADINTAIRLRGTVSRDIRAPNLNELFSTGLSTLSSAISPGTGTNVSIFTFASGNANLQPEVAKTYSAGIVLRPAPRFNVSVDYYNINLHDAIVSVGSAEVLSRCNAGETVFCSQLVFAGPIGSNGKPLLSQINTFPENIASLKTSGIDYQADYTFPLFSTGSLQLRLLGNYIINLQQQQLGNTYNLAGAIGSDNPGGTGFPKARATFSTTYNDGGL